MSIPVECPTCRGFGVEPVGVAHSQVCESNFHPDDTCTCGAAEYEPPACSVCGGKGECPDLVATMYKIRHPDVVGEIEWHNRVWAAMRPALVVGEEGS